MFVSIYDEIPNASAETLGGKGFGLYAMSKEGLNVPPALIIPTDVCVKYMQSPKEVMKSINKVFPDIRKFFVDKMGYLPLLSVRSGARQSMPGMMDTILNVGMDETTEKLWKKNLGEVCYADSLHRLVTMYGNVVHDLDRKELEKGDLAATLQYFARKVGPFPGAHQQLFGSIEAVFKSWNNERAKFYRKQNAIPETWGTAVVIQAMVFGNFNENSGSGVLFTRDPDTGKNEVKGEFLTNAQGEDVVAGIRTPMPLFNMHAWNPNAAAELLLTVEKLEQTRRDVQDVEFTIQDGKVYILQTRNAKRSPRAAVRIALDMRNEGVLTAKEAVKRVSARELDLVQAPVIDPKFKQQAHYHGLSACSGIVSAKPVFSAKDAINCKEPCILITEETTPDDIEGMFRSVGLITMNGGSTCHAAVVARGMNKPCIVGVGADIEVFKKSAMVSMDGGTGRIWQGAVPIVETKNDPMLAEFRSMLFDAMPFIEIITEVPEADMDVAYLDLSEYVLTDQKAMTTLYEGCVARVKKLYVDVRLAFSPDEEKFFGMFMMPDFDYEQSLLSNLPKKENVVFITNNKYPGAVQVVKTLEDYVLANGQVILELANVNGEAVKKVTDWKGEAALSSMVIDNIAENGNCFIASTKLHQHLS